VTEDRGQRPEVRGQKVGSSDASNEEATVVEQLPSAAFRLKLADDGAVIAHLAGASVRNFERLRPGDRVRVELSPHDRTRGRIVELLK
jgi:translation initiation factor IF-1